MRRFITTEKKRKQLNALWRKYNRAVVIFCAPRKTSRTPTVNNIAELRDAIEDFVYDNGGTLE
jgi:hypothetical protein